MTSKRNKNSSVSKEEENKALGAYMYGDRPHTSIGMEERYPLAYSMFDNEQEDSSTKMQPMEDETIAVTDSGIVTPPTTVTEPLPIDSTEKDCNENSTREEPVVKTDADTVSLPDGNDAKQPPMHRVSSKQRRLSLEEYRSVYLPVPKIENRMPVFISATLRDELDKMARRLGGKRMSASGIVENMVKHHLIVYGDELKEWYKL